MTPRVLLVEDDLSLGRTLADRLAKERLTVAWVKTIADARLRLAEAAWDLAVVDVRLPDGSGFGLARQIKSTTATPVMFMTALNSAENRLEGFEIGADEYLPKPFHLKEFILRVRHVLSTQRPRRVVRMPEAVVDLDALTVQTADGRHTTLQARDSRVLELLISASPRVIGRIEILERVWGEERFPTPRSVDNAVVRLRQALGDADARRIRSVRSVGYQWVTEDEA